jgi:DNA-binding transcriptional LysR family regulator
MNVHHLELFYYVARHGGISEAARQMPYGIQQPAISGQIIQLEEYIGATLFHRRPFALTPAGERLYEFVRPFFDNLGNVADQLRGGMAQHIRIAASEIVIRDYLPRILQELGRQFPRLKVTLKEGYHPQTLTWFQNREIDVSIGLLGAKPGHSITALPMFRLPLVLLVPKACRLKAAGELWKQDRISETLITVPSNEPICRALQEGLESRKVDWFSGIEVSTVDLVQTYVANGYGYGVTVGVPRAKWHPEVRVLPLEGFPLTTFGLLWQGRKTPVLEGLIQLLEAAARQIMTGQDESLLLLK